MTHSLASRTAAAALLSLLVLGGVAPSAAARPDPGDAESFSIGHKPTNCPLRRIDTQLVRCDDLTGAGVPAPVLIPELEAQASTGR